MSDINCEFTSVWEDGAIVTTPCTYNTETGEVSPEVSKGPIPNGALKREYITLPNGDVLDVCPTCHEYVLKTAVGNRADLSYGEYPECSNPDCNDEE